MPEEEKQRGLVAMSVQIEIALDRKVDDLFDQRPGG
jgi:hypothetical protein